MLICGTSYKYNEELDIPGIPGKEGNGKLGMEGSWNGAFRRSRPAMASSMPKNDKDIKIENNMNNLILIVILSERVAKRQRKVTDLLLLSMFLYI